MIPAVRAIPLTTSSAPTTLGSRRRRSPALRTPTAPSARRSAEPRLRTPLRNSRVERCEITVSGSFDRRGTRHRALRRADAGADPQANPLASSRTSGLVPLAVIATTTRTSRLIARPSMAASNFARPGRAQRRRRRRCAARIRHLTNGSAHRFAREDSRSATAGRGGGHDDGGLTMASDNIPRGKVPGFETERVDAEHRLQNPVPGRAYGYGLAASRSTRSIPGPWPAAPTATAAPTPFAAASTALSLIGACFRCH